jgi:NADH-quinone oxidoreductase subunit C
MIDLSAKTVALEATPAPRGKPGGPGLYHQKGNEHSPYFQQVVKALIEKRGMPPGKAYAIAWGAMRKWSKGGGKVHPEVRAAAAGGLSLEKAAAARAHTHAVTWDDHCAVLEMAITRVAAGMAGGGQFGSGGAAAAPVQSPAQKAAAKAALLATAKDDRAKAAVLGKERSVLRKALASAGGAVSKGQLGAKTKKSTAPAKKTPAAAAARAKATAAAKAKVAAAGKAPGAAAQAAQAVQIKTQIAGLNTQINGLLAAATAATAQAAAIK